MSCSTQDQVYLAVSLSVCRLYTFSVKIVNGSDEKARNNNVKFELVWIEIFKISIVDINRSYK